MLHMQPCLWIYIYISYLYSFLFLSSTSFSHGNDVLFIDKIKQKQLLWIQSNNPMIEKNNKNPNHNGIENFDSIWWYIDTVKKFKDGVVHKPFRSDIWKLGGGPRHEEIPNAEQAALIVDAIDVEPSIRIAFKAKLVFGDIVDQVDLIVERESASKRW